MSEPEEAVFEKWDGLLKELAKGPQGEYMHALEQRLAESLARVRELEEMQEERTRYCREEERQRLIDSEKAETRIAELEARPRIEWCFDLEAAPEGCVLLAVHEADDQPNVLATSSLSLAVSEGEAPSHRQQRRQLRARWRARSSRLKRARPSASRRLLCGCAAS